MSSNILNERTKIKKKKKKKEEKVHFFLKTRFFLNISILFLPCENDHHLNALELFHGQ